VDTAEFDRAARNQVLNVRAFAARLDSTMKRSQASTKAIASGLSVSRADVIFWRTGVTSPTRNHCRRLARLLHVSEEWLWFGDFTLSHYPPGQLPPGSNAYCSRI
jgi:hypothetical protein